MFERREEPTRIFSTQSRWQWQRRLCAERVHATRTISLPSATHYRRMLCEERIDARLNDAEFLVLSGADIGDPQAFIRGLWLQVYEGAPMHLRSAVLRRLHALSRRLGVHYVHGEHGASA